MNACIPSLQFWLLWWLQKDLEKTVQKPDVKQSRSYANVGRPSKDFEESCPQGKWVQARKLIESSKNAGITSSLAFYKAAKLKADEEHHADASYVLSEIYKNPIENGSDIRSAMKSSEKEGKYIPHCKL